jgi:hypothetical protein
MYDARTADFPLVARLCEGAKQSWRDQSVKVRPR